MKKSVVASIGIGIAVAVIVGVVAASGLDGAAPVDPTPVEVTADVEKILVFASFYPYYEFTKNVAGEHAIVEQYLPSGVEAHDWEPRALEIQSLKDADVFVYNGLGMEPYVDNLMESGEFEHVSFVKASESVELVKPDEDHDEHGHEEEHGEHEEEHGEHAKEFLGEIDAVIDEFAHGHITESQTLEQIEEILHQHEGDGHDHGNQTIETIEELLHEVEDGHFSAEQGIEEIYHFILEATKKLNTTTMPSMMNTTTMPSMMNTTTMPSMMNTTTMPSMMNTTTMPSMMNTTTMPSMMNTTTMPSMMNTITTMSLTRTSGWIQCWHNSRWTTSGTAL